MVLSGKIAKKEGVIRLDFEGRAVENFFSTLNISKTGGAILTKFSGLRVSWGPVYGLDPTSVGVQISRGARGKVAKNGISNCGWVTLGGSLNFFTVGISNIFAGFVSRATWQHNAYICETYWWRIKKLGEF